MARSSRTAGSPEGTTMALALDEDASPARYLSVGASFLNGIPIREILCGGNFRVSRLSPV
jgi:hypothetical protein